MQKFLLITPLLFTMAFNTATASKLTVDGEMSAEFKYEHNTLEDFKKTGYKVTSIVNFNYKFDKHWLAYTRLAAQQANLKYDFYTNQENGTTDTKVALDHFGIIYQNAGLSYKLGQQSLVIGQQGLIFDNTSYVGREMSAVKALSVTGTVGNTEFMAAYGHMYATPILEDESLKIAALSFTTTVGKNTKLGASYAHSNHKNINRMNNYSLHVEQQFGKLQLQLEGMRSSAQTDNKAYAFSVAYEPTDKDYFAIVANKSEANAAIGGFTPFENDQKGFVYKYERKLNDKAVLKLEYVDNRYISQSGKYRVFTTALAYRF